MTQTFPFFNIAKSQAFFSQMISIIKKKGLFQFLLDFKTTVVSPIHQYIDHVLHKAEKSDGAINLFCNSLTPTKAADQKNQVLSWRFRKNSKRHIYISAYNTSAILNLPVTLR